MQLLLSGVNKAQHKADVSPGVGEAFSEQPIGAK